MITAFAARHGLTIIDTVYPSQALHSLRRVIVMLPRGYADGIARYPVVALLHGHPGGPPDLFTTLQGAIPAYATDAGIAPFVAVVPDGNGPVIDDSWWTDIPSQQLATAATRDLRRWAQRKFRINASWSYAGLSSGGYGAAYLPTVDKRPVHAECGLSGYYDASAPPIPRGASQAVRDTYSPIADVARAPHLVFLAYGSHDVRTRRETLAYAAALHRVRRRVIIRVYPGRHEWRVWRLGFRDCLRVVIPARTP